jgi:hypothetical protein
MEHNGAALAQPPSAGEQTDSSGQEPIVSTHVLVSTSHAERLRELSRRTRVAQSEYLREAVDNLLDKYFQMPKQELRNAGK